MSARLFTALIPSAEVVEALAEFIEPRRGADPQLRWTSPQSWHITTCFMASVASDRLDRLVENLTETAARTPPLSVRLGGAGAFPNPYAARLLHLTASATPAGELERLAAGCRRAASRAGVEPDGARFVPHLTLARLRRPAEATRWLRILDAAPPLAFTASELALVESHLNDPQNRYEIVEWFALGGVGGAGYPAPDVDG
nr:RNA 2',3'-cyclic phosphodiesterase [Propionibacterium sp.]